MCFLAQVNLAYILKCAATTSHKRVAILCRHRRFYVKIAAAKIGMSFYHCCNLELYDAFGMLLLAPSGCPCGGLFLCIFMCMH